MPLAQLLQYDPMPFRPLHGLVNGLQQPIRHPAQRRHDDDAPNVRRLGQHQLHHMAYALRCGNGRAAKLEDVNGRS